MEDGLIGATGEADNLADGTAYFLTVADDFFLFGNLALEELTDVGEGVVLLEEGEEAGICYSFLTSSKL